MHMATSVLLPLFSYVDRETEAWWKAISPNSKEQKTGDPKAYFRAQDSPSYVGRR